MFNQPNNKYRLEFDFDPNVKYNCKKADYMEEQLHVSKENTEDETLRITNSNISITPNSDILYKHTEASSHSQTVGSDGPTVFMDTKLHETLSTFVNSTTLDRVVHTKGFGAFGYFETTNSMSEYTMAPFLQKVGNRVKTASRFSFAVSNKGTPDTGRNVRGFSTKFYTDDGIFDLLCNHIPVFIIRDAIRFPESINAFLPSPVNNLADPNRFWRFVANAPESTNFVIWLYTDLGTIKSFRHLRTYGVNTYIWRNFKDEIRYVKYHLIPKAGIETIDRKEAALLAGTNPDISGKDLYNHIKSGGNVEYELKVQLMDLINEKNLDFDPLDDTKVWDEKIFPLIDVGNLILNQNPINHYEEVDRMAFSPSNLQRGIELSNDKMLQGRANIYFDAQRHRLGQEFRKLPINNQPNWTPDLQHSSGIGTYVSGEQTRSSIPKQNNFSQAGELYNSLSDMQKEHLIDNLGSDLANVSKDVIDIVIEYLSIASIELGQKVLERINELK